VKRSLLSTSTAIAIAIAVAPATASATITEVGATRTPIASPICPPGVTKTNCTIILTETTALPALSDKVYYPTTVKTAGRIVAFTVGLASLATTDITGLNAAYGGQAEAAIAILKRKGRSFEFTVKYATPLVKLQPYLGHVVQFPLSTTLPVVPGDLIALTVPTWAPVLYIQLPSKSFRYRASRAKLCTTFNVQTAQQTVGQKATYNCFYDSTRVEFSATEVTNPVAGK
jgi:hypothetical protein